MTILNLKLPSVASALMIAIYFKKQEGWVGSESSGPAQAYLDQLFSQAGSDHFSPPLLSTFIIPRLRDGCHQVVCGQMFIRG